MSGVFCPQDDKAVNAIHLLETIAKGIGRSYYKSKCLGLFVKIISFLPIVKKAYGGIEYSNSLSTIEGLNYVIVPFEEGMKRTVAI